MKNNLAKNLKKLRKEENLSQEQLADLLGVSRQSVSKWETEEAYPEMDKILLLCSKFGLDINDLLNGDIYEVKHKGEAIKEVNKIIDNTVNFFVDTFSLFFKMTFKSKIKFILELIFSLIILSATFLILGRIIREIFFYLFYFIFPNKVYNFLNSTISFIYYLIVIILSLSIVITIIKNRYLKYYKEPKIEVKDEKKVEPEDKGKIEFKNKESKIIIRDSQDSNYKEMHLFYKTIILFFKALLSFIIIPILILLVFLAFGLISSFLIIKTGFFFIGSFITILSSIMLCSLILLILLNFIFNRKNNFKVFIYTSIVNLIVIGLGIGLMFIGSLSFNFIDSYDSKIFKTNELTVEMHDNFKIENQYIIAGKVKLIEENRSDLKIVYDYNSSLYLKPEKTSIIKRESENDNYIYINHLKANSFDVFKAVLKNLNEYKSIYSSDKFYNFKIYGSKENLAILKEDIIKNNHHIIIE